MRKPAAVPIAFALFVSSWFSLSGAVRADEPFLKKDDVIAIVGGEDMVAMSEYGYLELLLTRALPDHRLKFRCLAWEGDTVFEQRRDLNFPTLEQQLEQIGATVVICQFGQMESLAGKEKLPEFVAAYEKLTDHFSKEGKRRAVVVAPTPFECVLRGELSKTPERTKAYASYSAASEQMAKTSNYRWVAFKENFSLLNEYRATATEMRHRAPLLKTDSLHLSDRGHELFGAAMFISIMGGIPVMGKSSPGERQNLRQIIIAKNRLWHNYTRLQNWAFLAGDRTNQPSSRDHLDASKRWFPEERERFLPLIEKKEQEIWALAAKLAQP